MQIKEWKTWPTFLIRHRTMSAEYATHADHDTDQTQHRATEIQCDHHTCPHRALVIPEIEVEAVKAVIDPTLETLAPRETADDAAHSRIDIKPCRVSISEFHSKHRQWRLSFGRVIVRVVRRKQNPVGNGHVGIPTPDSLKQRVRWKRFRSQLERSSRNERGIGIRRVSDVIRIVLNANKFDLFQTRPCRR